MFYCNIQAFPQPKVKWYLNKTNEITAGPTVQFKNMRRKKINQYMSVLILDRDSVTSKDAGSYECEASNAAESDRDLVGWLIDKSSM